MKKSHFAIFTRKEKCPIEKCRVESVNVQYCSSLHGANCCSKLHRACLKVSRTFRQCRKEGEHDNQTGA